MFTFKTCYDIFGGIIVLTQLVSQTEPSFPEIIIPSKQLDLVCRWHQQVNQSIDLLWLLRFLSDFSNQEIIGDLGVELNVLVGWALVPNQACLAAVEEVEAVADVYLLVLGLDPGQLVDHFVSPFVHAFIANIHL